jgi:hypothetical protein
MTHKDLLGYYMCGSGKSEEEIEHMREARKERVAAIVDHFVKISKQEKYRKEQL